MPVPKIGLRSKKAVTPSVLQEVTEDVVEAVKRSLHISVQAAPDWAKAWHNWGLFNVNAMEKYSRTDVPTANQHVAPAVAAFFKSVSLSQASGSEPPQPSSTMCLYIRCAICCAVKPLAAQPEVFPEHPVL